MLKTVVNLLLNYIVQYIFIPISWVIVDYFRMKKTIKKQNEEINELKNAKTKADIDRAIDNLN